MPELTISLLGNPDIEINGEPIDVDTRKAIAILAYLAVTGHSHSRDHLTALLWPEFDTSRARAALRRTLSSLRKALGGDWIRIEGDSVDLECAAGCWIDIEEFQGLVKATESHGHPRDQVCADCRQPLSQAAELYRGDFLEGFSLRDSAEFDDWQLFQGEALRMAFADVLQKLILIYLQQGTYDLAIAGAHRWLLLDPLSEEAHRQLMRAYAISGQRAAALRQYQDFTQLLDRELGVPPLEETTELYEQIRSDRLPVPEIAGTDRLPQGAAASDAGPSQATLPRPLVGRRVPLESLLSAYRAVGPDGCFILVRGEAGIGKTRLSQEFLREVEALGGKTITMRSYEGDVSLAYAPILEAMRSFLQLPEGATRLKTLPPASLSEAARLLPEIHNLMEVLPLPPPLEGPGAQSRFLEGLSEVLESFCGGPRPGVLFLDDLQWADGATIDLWTYLAHRLRSRPLVLLATVRSEAVAADPRLHQLMAKAQQAPADLSIELERLNPEDLHDLLSSTRLADVGPQVEDSLYRTTEGLPYFIVEYLTVLDREDEGEDGEISEWPVPGGVRELLHSRLSSVDGMGLQLLATAAVIGRSFDFETLRAASGRSEEETVGGLETLLGMGLIREVGVGDNPGNPVYDFNHEQLRSLVYGETSLARRRLLHRRVGEALQIRGRRLRQEEALAGKIAQHLRMGGNEQEAAIYYNKAGEAARGVYANEEAIQQFRLALEVGYENPAGLHLAIGDLQILNGAYRSALQSYESAAVLSDEATLAVLEHKIGIVYHRLGEWGLAESHFQASLASLVNGDELSVERARVLADWSLNAYRQGHEADALDKIEEARQLAESADDPRSLAQVYNILGILARSGGDLNRSREDLERSLVQSESLDDLSAQIAALNNLALVHAEAGDLEEAKTHFLRALELCARLGDRHREAALYNNLADLSQRAKDPEAAMDYLKKAVSLFAEVGLGAGELQPEIWKLVEW